MVLTSVAMLFSVHRVGLLLMLVLNLSALWETALTDTIPHNTLIHIDDSWPTFTVSTDSQTAGDWEVWSPSESQWMPLCRDVHKADKYVCSQDKGMVHNHTLSLMFAGAAVAAAYLFCADVVNCTAFLVNVFSLSTVEFNSLLAEAMFSFTSYGNMTAEPYLDCGNMSYRCSCNSSLLHEFSCRCNVSLHDDLTCRPWINFVVPSHIQSDLRFELANNTVHITGNRSVYRGNTSASNAKSCSYGCIAAIVIGCCIGVGALLLVFVLTVKLMPHCRLSKFVGSVQCCNKNGSKQNMHHEVSAESPLVQQNKHISSTECSGANVSEMPDTTVSDESGESCTSDATEEDKILSDGNCQDTSAEDIVELKESEKAVKFIGAQCTNKAIKTSSDNQPKFDPTQLVILCKMGDEGNGETVQHTEPALNKTEINVIVHKSGRVCFGNREVILNQDKNLVGCKALKPADIDSNERSDLEEVVVDDNSTLTSC